MNIEELIKKGFSVMPDLESGLTLLHTAVISNRPALVDIILQQRTDLINVMDNHSRTCLMIACDADEPNMDIISSLVDHGADVNLSNSKSETPLYIACKLRKLELIKLLLSQKAYIDCFKLSFIDEKNDTIRNIVDFLLSQPTSDKYYPDYEKTCIMLLCQTYRCDTETRQIFENILKHNPSVTSTTSGNTTPLYLATKNNHLMFAELLLRYGANVNNAHVQCEMLPLHAAIIKDNKKLIELLLRYGADVNLCDHLGQNALLLALKFREKYANLLLPLTDNINPNDGYGWTALRYAVEKQNIDIVSQLTNGGADIDSATLYYSVAACNAKLFKIIWLNIDANIPSGDALFIMNIFDYWTSCANSNKLLQILFQRNDVQFVFHLHSLKLLNFIIFKLPFADISNYASLFLSNVIMFFERDDKINFTGKEIKYLIRRGSQSECLGKILHIVLERATVYLNEGVILQAISLHLPYISVLVRYCLHLEPNSIYSFMSKKRSLILYYLKYFLRLFTISNRWKREFILTINQEPEPQNAAFIELLQNQPFVPTLNELSRDVIRRCLQGTCKNNKEYLAALDVLPLSGYAKDIIQCKIFVNN